MALQIDTTSAQYQQYLIGLTNLRGDMLPRFKAFSCLSIEKQRWWLQRDPLMRRLIKTAIIINKWAGSDNWINEVQND